MLDKNSNSSFSLPMWISSAIFQELRSFEKLSSYMNMDCLSARFVPQFYGKILYWILQEACGFEMKQYRTVLHFAVWGCFSLEWMDVVHCKWPNVRNKIQTQMDLSFDIKTSSCNFVESKKNTVEEIYNSSVYIVQNVNKTEIWSSSKEKPSVVNRSLLFFFLCIVLIPAQ